MWCLREGWGGAGRGRDVSYQNLPQKRRLRGLRWCKVVVVRWHVEPPTYLEALILKRVLGSSPRRLYGESIIAS